MSIPQITGVDDAPTQQALDDIRSRALTTNQAFTPGSTIPANTTFGVPANRQMFFSGTLDVAGTLNVMGDLISVDMRQPKSFGRVTSLPTGDVVDGDTCIYRADNTNGVYWQFMYDGVGTYPWKYIGGPWLKDEVVTQENTASGTYTDLATVGPTVIVPLAGDWDVHLNVRVFSYGGAASGAYSYSVNGATALDADGADWGEGSAVTSVGGGMYRLRRRTFAAQTELKTKYKAAAGTPLYTDRTIGITPVRCSG